MFQKYKIKYDIHPLNYMRKFWDMQEKKRVLKKKKKKNN